MAVTTPTRKAASVHGLTYAEFERFMRQYEQDATDQKVANAWAIWCKGEF